MSDNKANNSSIELILEELNFNDKEKEIFMESIQKIKLEQINDEIDAKTEIFESIREEFK